MSATTGMSDHVRRVLYCDTADLLAVVAIVRFDPCRSITRMG